MLDSILRVMSVIPMIVFAVGWVAVTAGTILPFWDIEVLDLPDLGTRLVAISLPSFLPLKLGWAAASSAANEPS